MDISIGDARSIFIDCLLEVDKRPVYVLNIDVDGAQYLLDLERQEIKVRKVVDFSSYRPLQGRMGFINHLGNAVFASRTTTRQYKFGLSSNNMAIKALDADSATYKAALADLASVRHPAFLNTLQGKYPSFEEAYTLVCDLPEFFSVAFDRQFAVVKGGGIFYKTSFVGNVRNGAIVFLEDYAHLAGLL